MGEGSARGRGGRCTSTREAILAATQALLLEGGADQVSIRRVEERCGYKAPTIYHHFRDKTGLIDALLEERFAELFARLRRVPRPADPAAYLRELARAFSSSGSRTRATTRCSRRRAASPAELLPSAEAARELVFRALAEVARRGALRTPDLESAFQLPGSCCTAWCRCAICRPSYAWCEDLVELALDVIERGILLARGAAR